MKDQVVIKWKACLKSSYLIAVACTTSLATIDINTLQHIKSTIASETGQRTEVSSALVRKVETGGEMI